MQRPQLRGRARLVSGLVAFALGASIHVAPSHAGVVVHGTRFVYPADRREVTVELRNEGDTPSLVQAWIDNDDPNPDKPNLDKTVGPVPFSLTPAIFRLDAKNGQSLRILYTGRPLATDRETLFWLNVLDIPPKAPPNPNAPNHLAFAFRHRMKLFFRPARLPGNVGDAAANVSWTLQRDSTGARLIAINPTPYHVSLTRLDLTSSGGTMAATPAMLIPLATTSFALAPNADPRGVRVSFDYIDDYGGTHTGEAAVRTEPVGN